MVYVRNEAGWQEFTQSASGDIQQNIRDRAILLQQYARAQVGKLTGALAASIGVKPVRSSAGLAWQVGSSNKIAYLHHEGTRAHVIMPNRARILRFRSKGRIVYARIVHHPGTKPNRYLTDNLRRVV